MFPEKKRSNEPDCPICYAAHDEEIHEATLRLRHWFHYEVTNRLNEAEYFAAAAEPGFAPAQVA